MRFAKPIVTALILVTAAGCGDGSESVNVSGTGAATVSSSIPGAAGLEVLDTEQPSLLDFSNIGGASDVFDYEIATVGQLRDIVSSVLMGTLIDIRAGLEPSENWGISPGTFLAEFSVIDVFGGRRMPVAVADGRADAVTVSVRLDRAAVDVPATLEILRQHLGETYLLFLTPDYEPVTGIPTGRYSLAPYPPASVLRVADDGSLEPISVAEELLKEAIARGEKLTGQADPTKSDPVDEAQLAAGLRSTYLGELLDMNLDQLRTGFAQPVGKPAEELGITGDQQALQRTLDRNADFGPNIVEVDW